MTSTLLKVGVRRFFSLRIVEWLLAPFVLLSGGLLLAIRKIGVGEMKFSRRLFEKIGVFPIADHYYEPLFNSRHLRRSLEEERNLPGIDFNEQGQVALLRQLHYQDELLEFPMKKRDEISFFYENGTFEGGDAECLYSLIRHLRPARVVEVGSGYSTLMAVSALRRNQETDPSYQYEHVCIEPYEKPWLSRLPVTLLRERVEDLDPQELASLGRNDILFIDSSHVIRPQGDVTFEFLELLPRLKPGVYVHIHDIFTPRDYPTEWVKEHVRLWNEQYLLEAFLSFNSAFEIVAAMNFLKHHHPDEVRSRFPILDRNWDLEPGSFWMRRKEAS